MYKLHAKYKLPRDFIMQSLHERIISNIVTSKQKSVANDPEQKNMTILQV